MRFYNLTNDMGFIFILYAFPIFLLTVVDYFLKKIDMDSS